MWVSFHSLLNLCLLLISVELEACVIFIVVLRFIMILKLIMYVNNDLDFDQIA